jgi:hypothetical protein
MTWRQALQRAIRTYLINLLLEPEAQDLIDNGFNTDDLVVVNGFLDSPMP